MSAARQFFPLIVCAVGLAGTFGAGAETLRDPTRPAFDVEAGRDGAANGAAAGSTSDSSGAANRYAPRGPRLQSILIRADGSALAVIDGRTLAIGDRFGSGRLVAIAAGQVTLRGPEGQQVLRLTPAADKKPKTPGTPVAAQRGRKTP